MNQLKYIHQASNTNNPFGKSKQSQPELQVQHIISYEQLSIDSIEHQHQLPNMYGVPPPPQSSLHNQYNSYDQYIPTNHGIYQAQQCFELVDQNHQHPQNGGKLLSCIESVDDEDIPMSLIVPILRIQDYHVQSKVQVALPITDNIQENTMFASKSSNHTDQGTATSPRNPKRVVVKDAVQQTKNKKQLGYYSYQICMYIHKQPTGLPSLSNCDSIISSRVFKPTHRRATTLMDKKGKEHKMNKQNLSKLSSSGSSINSVYFQILKNYKPINIKAK